MSSPICSPRTTPSFRPPPDLPHLLAEVRSLTSAYRTGDPGAFGAFRDLVSLLLNLTVLAPLSGGLRLIRGREHDKAMLGGGDDPLFPLRLTDGRFLRLAVSMLIDPTPQGPRLTILQSSYQYQNDRAGDEWIFRYEYLRYGADRHPPAHLQVRADAREPDASPHGQPLERIHFPTGRVSLEAVIRLLVEEFAVPCRQPDVWHQVLAESERHFLEIAYRPLSGPGA